MTPAEMRALDANARSMVNLRARVDALAAFRDRMADLLTTAEYDELTRLMLPWTDALLWRLAFAEHGSRAALRAKEEG